MDLLRACQKDGLLRMERDRRGGLRVFPGAAVQRGPSSPSLPQADVADEAPLIPGEAGAGDFEAQPPVDPTAELLGRAKGRRPRTRAAAPDLGARKKRAPSTKRPARSKKTASADDDNAGNV